MEDEIYLVINMDKYGKVYVEEAFESHEEAKKFCAHLEETTVCNYYPYVDSMKINKSVEECIKSREESQRLFNDIFNKY